MPKFHFHASQLQVVFAFQTLLIQWCHHPTLIEYNQVVVSIFSLITSRDCLFKTKFIKDMSIKVIIFIRINTKCSPTDSSLQIRTSYIVELCCLQNVIGISYNIIMHCIIYQYFKVSHRHLSSTLASTKSSLVFFLFFPYNIKKILQ